LWFFRELLLSQDWKVQHCGWGCGRQLENVPRYICKITWECEWLYVLRKFGLYQRAQHGGLFDMTTRSQDGMQPYLHGDNGYPFLSWLMTPHKKEGEHHSILELL
jgi:hypothetical protein